MTYSVVSHVAVIGALVVAAGSPALGQSIRPADQTGIVVFEAPKQVEPFDKLAVAWGAAFTQDYQRLSHRNTATPVMVGLVNSNELIGIGPGFTTAMANLGLSVELARGIRVDLTSYLSTRHHTNTWVKSGYIQIDASPWDVDVLNTIMQYTTLRVGQFEVNYGDAHFRRTDGGNGMYNPFVGNLIIDAFSTEIGAEVSVRRNGWIALAGLTGGGADGEVTSPGDRKLAYLAKVGFDKPLGDNVRGRLTASTYRASKSTGNVLYSGDRAGSHYFDVLQNTTSTEAGQSWSGNIQPGFTNHVTAYVVNPFIKYGDLELFGNIETATGAAASETSDRTWRQVSGDVVYRFLPADQMYVAARINNASGSLVGVTEDVNVRRTQLGVGVFVTPNLLAKLEWVNQDYNDYPTNNILNGGRFRGLMFEGAVAF